MSKSNRISTRVDRKRKIIATISLVVFAAFIALITIFAAQKIDELSKDPLVFREWIQSFGFWGKFVFVGLAFVQVILAMIPGGPVQIAAGYAFGIVEGSILCVIGIQLGSALAFILARQLGMKVIDLFVPREKIENIRFLQNSERLDIMTFLCFLIPGVPKDPLAYFSGLTKIPFWKFLLLSTLGRIPSIIISVMSGNALVEQQYITAIITFAVLAAFSVIGILIYKRFISAESNKQVDKSQK